MSDESYKIAKFPKKELIISSIIEIEIFKKKIHLIIESENEIITSFKKK